MTADRRATVGVRVARMRATSSWATTEPQIGMDHASSTSRNSASPPANRLSLETSILAIAPAELTHVSAPNHVANIVKIASP